MTKEEWRKIIEARELFGLESKATLKEIKQAYRRMAKIYHPDLATDSSRASIVQMHEITAAYDVLLDYCESFRFPLTLEDPDSLDAEDWWFDRFGRDPLWGKKSG